MFYVPNASLTLSLALSLILATALVLSRDPLTMGLTVTLGSPLTLTNLTRVLEFVLYPGNVPD